MKILHQNGNISAYRARFGAYFGFFLFGVISLAKLTTPYMAVATVAYAALCMGIYLRKKARNWHGRFMALGCSLDLSLVLVLEIQRSAIKTAAGFELSFLQKGHILFSTLAILLYVPNILIGISLLKGGLLTSDQRRWHKYVGWSAFAFRTFGFILMFSLLNHVLVK